MKAPAHYYRFDRWASLRQMRGQTDFLPRRWDLHEHRWPHACLVAAQEALRGHRGIFRICFWRDLKSAKAHFDHYQGFDRYLLTRVRRDDVYAALKGWHVDEDDALPGQADLIWSVQDTTHGDEHFHRSGVPLRLMEVLDPSDHRWHPWISAPALRPDAVRLSGWGWQPLVLRLTTGASLAHWKLQRARSGLYWILLMVDDAHPERGLAQQDAALSAATQQLLTGPLSAGATEVAGLITVCPTADRIWTEQLAVYQDVEAPTSLRRRLWQALGVSEPAHRWCVESRPGLSSSEELALIIDAGLEACTPEFNRAWQALRLNVAHR